MARKAPEALRIGWLRRRIVDAGGVVLLSADRPDVPAVHAAARRLAREGGAAVSVEWWDERHGRWVAYLTVEVKENL